jgi:hypothetical protein
MIVKPCLKSPVIIGVPANPWKKTDLSNMAIESELLLFDAIDERNIAYPGLAVRKCDQTGMKSLLTRPFCATILSFQSRSTSPRSHDAETYRPLR